jgi:hypothetical protein
LLALKPGKTHRCAQFPEFRTLFTCDRQCLLEVNFCFVNFRPAGLQQHLALKPM